MTSTIGSTDAKQREETIRGIARALLESASVEGVLALRRVKEHVEPFLFTKPEELEELSLSGHYTIASVARRMCELWPQARLAVVVRGCDERHLIELAKKGCVDLANLELIGLACTGFEASECKCVKPYPRQSDAGQGIGDVYFMQHENLADLASLDMAGRRRFWTEVFARCIKCYGCRNTCPLCNCDDCRLETSNWVRVGEIPPEFPSFHFIRALHMADKCVGCGACARACPMGIPLADFHTLIREDLKRLFGYEAGRDPDETSPLNTDLEKGPLKVMPDGL